MEIIEKLGKSEVISSVFEFVSNAICFLIRKLVRKSKSDNVAIISLHKIGDTTFTIPAVQKILEIYDKNNIYIFTFNYSRDIYNLVFNSVNYRIVKKEDFYFEGRIAKRNVKQMLKECEPKLIFDLTGNISSASLLFSSAAKKIIGMNSKYFKKLYDVYLPIRNKPHLIDRYLDIVNHNSDLINITQAYDFPSTVDTAKKILIHPFAGWRAKEWNLKKFIELASLLDKNYNTAIIALNFILSEDVIIEIEKNKIPLIITSSVTDLIKEIGECSVFISNDSGPLYIANILGKATFSIYGPTNPDFSLPHGKNHKYFQNKIICSPVETQYCFTHAGLYCPSNECMQSISVEEVFQSISSFLVELNINKKNV